MTPILISGHAGIWKRIPDLPKPESIRLPIICVKEKHAACCSFQTNLLVQDNVTRTFESIPFKDKTDFARFSWGKFLSSNERP